MPEKQLLIEESLYDRITETETTKHVLHYAIANTVVLSSMQKVQKDGAGKVFVALALGEVFEKQGTLRNLMKVMTVIDLLDKMYALQPSPTAADDVDESDDGDDKDAYRIRKAGNTKASLSTDGTDALADLLVLAAMAGGYTPTEAKQVRLDNPAETQVGKANLGVVAMGFKALGSGTMAQDVRVVHNLDGWDVVDAP